MSALPRASLSAAFLATMIAALPLDAAETPMTGAEFGAYVTGRTLTFYSLGQPYGIERYKDDRRVTWSFLDGECKEGVWYEEGSQICFVYEDNPTPQCWTFYRESSGLRALYEGGVGETQLYEAGQADEEMLCYGPDVGV